MEITFILILLDVFLCDLLLKLKTVEWFLLQHILNQFRSITRTLLSVEKLNPRSISTVLFYNIQFTILILLNDIIKTSFYRFKHVQQKVFDTECGRNKIMSLHFYTIIKK